MQRLAIKKSSSKASKPQLYLESGQQGRIGVLRDLHQIQLSVPDKYFFVNKLRAKKGKNKNKGKSGFFSGFSGSGGKKVIKHDIEKAIEMVKPFYTSFQIKSGTTGIRKTSESGKMSVSAMNDFRKKIREVVAIDESDFRWNALDAIVKFIDLKNSGLVKDKQLIQQNCLRTIGQALHEDGGLSMFHSTWFLTIYRDYLSGFRMFRTGEVENINKQGGREGANILKKLQARQLEIPVYKWLVDSKHLEVRQIKKYSEDGYVKRSRHGQRGCTKQDIKKIFFEKFKTAGADTAKTAGINEVNIVMAYAMLFARIPMLYEVVEFIKSAIPNISTETKLHRQKITIAQKTSLLDIASALYEDDRSEGGNKLYQLASSIYKSCINVISENRLTSVPLQSSIHTHPLMKQAALLIVYRKIFTRKKDLYSEMIKRSLEFLKPVKQCSNSADQSLVKIAGFADIYEQKLQAIESQINSTGF